MTWVDLETDILSEVKSDGGKTSIIRYHFYMESLKKNGTNEFIYKTRVESQMWMISLWLRGNKGWRVAIIWEIRIDRYTILCIWIRVSQMALVVKKQPANAGDIRDMGLDPWVGKIPGEENGNLLQYFCLENPMDRAAWWATVHRVSKSWTWLKWLNKQAIYINRIDN